MLPSSTMRAWVRHFLDYEAVSRGTSAQSEPATVLVFEKLRRRLTTTVSAAGFQAIAYRALSLARVEAPVLSEIEITKEGFLRGFKDLAIKLEDDGPGIVLISQVLGQLQTFLGGATMQRLVQDVYPGVDPTIELDASPPVVPMRFEGISQEAKNLRMVSESLELLAGRHPHIEDGLATISQNIRNTATLLEVFVAVRNASDGLRESNPTEQLTDYVM